MIGPGFLNALRYASLFYLVAWIFQRPLVGVLKVFAALSICEQVLLREGKTGKILLQLPGP